MYRIIDVNTLLVHNTIHQTARIRALLEITASAILGCLEPCPISSCYADELPRVCQAIARARDGRLARFRRQVNRNAFLLGCLDYADGQPEEHLVIGYGFRHGSTTRVEGLHHVVGDAGSVGLPAAVAHSMCDYYGQHEDNELLIFHNHPYSLLNFVLNNFPMPSRQDRLVLEARALNAHQLTRRVLGYGRVLFLPCR
jgi:hypothetical protein